MVRYAIVCMLIGECISMSDGGREKVLSTDSNRLLCCGVPDKNEQKKVHLCCVESQLLFFIQNLRCNFHFVHTVNRRKLTNTMDADKS